MLITRISQLTGNQNTMDLNVTERQMLDYRSGKGLLQNVFPNLTPSEREFIKSGITPQEWDEILSVFDE